MNSWNVTNIKRFLLDLEWNVSPESEKQIVKKIVESFDFHFFQSPFASSTPRVPTTVGSKKDSSFKAALRYAIQLEEGDIERFLEEESSLAPFLANQHDHIVDDVIEAVDVYLQRRREFWEVLCELLKIDLDVDHRLNRLASSTLTKIIAEKDLLSTLITHFTDIASWCPVLLRIDHIFPQKDFSFAMVENAVKAHAQAWEASYLSEMQFVCDALVLVTYRRQPMNLDDVLNLLDTLRTKDFTSLQRIASDSFRQQLQFRLVVVFCEALQFWRLFLDPHAQLELERHPLSDSESLKKVGALLKAETTPFFGSSDSGTQQLVVFQQQQATAPRADDRLLSADLRYLLHFLWDLFLKKKLVIPLPEQRKSKSGGKGHSAQRQIQAMEAALDFDRVSRHLLLLATHGLEQSSQETSPSASFFYQCTVLQEVLNVCIEAKCIVGDEELAELDFAIAAAQLAYQGRPELCAGLGEVWMNGQTVRDYPIVRLVQLLLENTFYEPVHLLRLLSAVAATPELRALICDLLKKPVHLTSFVARDMLRTRDSMVGNKLDFSYLDEDGAGRGEIDLDELRSEPSVEIPQWSKLDVTALDLDSAGAEQMSGTEVMFDGSLQRGRAHAARLFGRGGVEEGKDSMVQEDLTARVAAMLTQPADGDKGSLVEYGDLWCFVRWETQTMWWNVVLQELALYFLTRRVTPALLAVLELFHLLEGDLRTRVYLQRVLNARWLELSLLQCMRWLGKEDLVDHVAAQFHSASSLFTLDGLQTTMVALFDDAASLLRTIELELRAWKYVFCSDVDELLSTAVCGVALDAIFSAQSESARRATALQRLVVRVQQHPPHSFKVFFWLLLGRFQTRGPQSSDHPFDVFFEGVRQVLEQDDHPESVSLVFQLLQVLARSAELALQLRSGAETADQLAAQREQFVQFLSSQLSFAGQRLLWLTQTQEQGAVAPQHRATETAAALQTLLDTLQTLSRYAPLSADLLQVVASREALATLLQLATTLLADKVLRLRGQDLHDVDAAAAPSAAFTLQSLLRSRDATKQSGGDDKCSAAEREQVMPDVAFFVSEDVASAAQLQTVLQIQSSALQVLEAVLLLHLQDQAFLQALLELLAQPLQPVDLFLGLREAAVAVDSSLWTHPSLSRQRAGSAHNDQFSFFAALLWTASTQTLPYCAAAARQLRAQALSLLVSLLEAVPAGDAMNSWFLSLLQLDHVELVNVLVGSVLRRPRDGAEDAVLAWRFLTQMLARHPIALAMILGYEESRQTTHEHILRAPSLPGHRFSTIEGLAVAVAVAETLQSSKDVYGTQPALLAAVLQFVHMLFVKAPLFPTIGKFVLYLATQSGFWKNLFEPLVSDLPCDAEDVLRAAARFDAAGLTAEQCSYAQVVQQCEDERQLAPLCRAITAQQLATCERLVRESVAKCAVLVASLDLLALERYGALYDLDPELGLKTTADVNQLYSEAHIKARFMTWTKHYLKVTDPAPPIRELQETSAAMRWDVQQFAAPAAWLALPHLAAQRTGYGLLLRTALSEALVAQQHLRHLATGEKAESFRCLQQAVRWHNACATTNWMLSAAAAELALLDRYRAFLQTFTLPGSRIKAYVKRLRDTAARSSALRTPDKKTAADLSGLAPPESPVIGSLSPLTSLPDSSPISRQGSSFSGDKRSYEVVSEILNSFVAQRDDEPRPVVLVHVQCVATLLAVRAKTELLMVMLHHQLKTVSFKDADPSRSEVTSREIGTARMTQDKMEKTLERLLLVFAALFPADQAVSLTTRDAAPQLACAPRLNAHGLLIHDADSPAALRMQIMQSLLATLLMLLTSIHQYDGSGDLQSSHGERRMQVFELAFRLLVSVLQRHGVEALMAPLRAPDAQTTDADADAPRLRSVHVLFSLARTALQLLFSALPQGMTQGWRRSDVSINDHRRWTHLLARLQFADFLLELLRCYDQLLAADAEARAAQAQGEALAAGCEDFDLRALPCGNGGLACFDMLFAARMAQQDGAAVHVNSAQHAHLLSGLEALAQLAVRCMHAQLLSPESACGRRFLEQLLQQLSPHSEVLAQLRRSVGALDLRYAGALMGYDCAGEVGAHGRVFALHLQLWEAALMSLREHLLLEAERDAQAAAQEEARWTALFRALLRQFEAPLLAPALSDESLRVSLQQLHLLRRVFRFLAVLRDSLPAACADDAWVCEALRERGKLWLARICLVLSQSAAADTGAMQLLDRRHERVLSQCVIVRGAEEQLLTQTPSDADADPDAQPAPQSGSSASVSGTGSVPLRGVSTPAAGRGHVRFGADEVFSIRGDHSGFSSPSGSVSMAVSMSAAGSGSGSGSGSVRGGSPLRSTLDALKPRSILKHADDAPRRHAPLLGDASAALSSAPSSSSAATASSFAPEAEAELSAAAYAQEAQEAMLDSLQALLAVLRQSLHSPFEDEDPEPQTSQTQTQGELLPARRYRAGQTVFYLAPDHTSAGGASSLYEGVVLRVPDTPAGGAAEGCYEVRLASGLVDRVRGAQVVFTRPPPCAFRTGHEVHFRELLSGAQTASLAALLPAADLRTEALLRGGLLPRTLQEQTRQLAANGSLSLSTAHLLRALHTVVASVRLLLQRHPQTQTQPQPQTQVSVALQLRYLQELAAETAFVLLAALDHASRAPQGREPHMLQQLQEIQRLLHSAVCTPDSAAPSSSSASSSAQRGGADEEVSVDRRGLLLRMGSKSSRSGSSQHLVYSAASAASSGAQRGGAAREWWRGFVAGMDRWALRLLHRLDRPAPQPQSDAPALAAPAQPPAGKHRTSLRARVEWVHSLQDL